ncbi:hypothetical protein ABKV19_007513 [Rosa sericea]
MLPQGIKKAVTDNRKKLANLIDLVYLPSTLREFVVMELYGNKINGNIPDELGNLNNLLKEEFHQLGGVWLQSCNALTILL